jgi:hypothetical protein
MRGLALIAAAWIAASCAPPEDPFTCQSTSDCGDLGGVESCCTTLRCEYHVADGTTFACSGTDCTSAHVAVAAYCASHCFDASIPDASGDGAIDAAIVPCVH